VAGLVNRARDGHVTHKTAAIPEEFGMRARTDWRAAASQTQKTRVLMQQLNWYRSK